MLNREWKACHIRVVAVFFFTEHDTSREAAAATIAARAMNDFSLLKGRGVGTMRGDGAPVTASGPAVSFSP